jgi:hypothetical protein
MLVLRLLYVDCCLVFIRTVLSMPIYLAIIVIGGW